MDRGEVILARAQAVARKVEAQVHRVMRGEPPAANCPGVERPAMGTTDSCAKNLTFQPRKDKPAAAKND